MKRTAWDKPADDGIIEDEEDPFPQKYVAPTLETLKKSVKVPKGKGKRKSSSTQVSARPRLRDRRIPKDPMQCVVYLSRVRGNAMPLDALHELMIEKGVKDFETSRRPSLAATVRCCAKIQLSFKRLRRRTLGIGGQSGSGLGRRNLHQRQGKHGRRERG